MATRSNVWLTGVTGTEGTSTVYVDADFGSDVFGDGTRQKPLQTLSYAWNRNTTTRPSRIVCRGLFSEQMANGNHSTEVCGDYWGAAIFDGLNRFIMYGFTHNRMIFWNVPWAQGDEQVWSGSRLLAGVGRAAVAFYVGSAVHVIGVAGSSVSMHKSALYFGYIGGSTAVQKCVYDSPVHNSTYPISLGGNGAPFLTDCTVYGVGITDRVKNTNGNSIMNTVFARFAMIGNENRKMTYTKCVFAKDAKWYWMTSDRGDAGNNEELVLTGTTSAERQQSLLDQLAAKGLAANYTPVFNDCKFSNQTYDEIFNDAENGDFTLIPGCDADWQTTSNTYCGALPSSLRVRVMADSSGVAGTWDERSASGCLMVDTLGSGQDAYDAICIDTDSPSADGEIYSKILTIDPDKVQLGSVWTELTDRMATYGVKAWKDSIMGTAYSAGDTLPVGKYLVVGSGGINYDGNLVNPGNVVYVSSTGTTFTLDNPVNVSTLTEIVEASAMDVVYCRCRSVVYARVGVNDNLQRGATYLNDGNQNITYHNRTIVPGESFVCMIDNEQFGCPDSSYTIAVMFDDTRVPASEWIPAHTMGEYFVGKAGGAIVTDEYGVPESSGNIRTYNASLAKSVMDRRYVQFAIIVKRYGTGTVG